jgi:hypothetical protein
MAEQPVVVEIYALRCPDTNEVKYIGKANCSELRFKSHLRETRRQTPLYKWIKSLAEQSKVPVMTVERVVPFSEWEKAEVDEIKRYGIESLLNVARGGNQPECPREIRAENGRRNAKAVHECPKRRLIWELKQKLGVAIKQVHLREETKAKLRALAYKYPDDFGNWKTL